MTSGGRNAPAPSATSTDAPRMPMNPRYCPTRIRAVVPRWPAPRAKNSESTMMSSMFVAMNRPIACRTEDRIMRPPPRSSCLATQRFRQPRAVDALRPSLFVPGVVWAAEVEQEAESDADAEDDVGKVSDEQVAVSEEVGDVTAAEPRWGEQPVQEVADC